VIGKIGDGSTVDASDGIQVTNGVPVQAVWVASQIHWKTTHAIDKAVWDSCRNLTTQMVDMIEEKYNKIFSDYQLCKVVKWRKNQRFEDHLCPHPQGTLEMVLEMLVFSPFKHLTQVARENWIVLSCRESSGSYIE
jgi:hypothetical protein